MDNLISYLKSIYVRDCYVSQDFEIKFAPKDDQFARHLILTGKNGSGKTTVLQELNRFFVENCDNSPLMTIELSEKPEYTFFFPAHRHLVIDSVESPKKLTDCSSKNLLQYLVNKRTSQASEFLEKRDITPFIQEIDEWFNHFEQNLKQLFGFDQFELQYDGKEFDFYCQVSEQVTFPLSKLSDGYNSVLHIFTELLLTAESQGINSNDFMAIVLIDEIEIHLHLELQETILPFLIAMFPKVQFIIATYSPAVIASIDNATVYDLSQHKTIDEDLRGYPYQFLMKNHFNIESEYSIFITKKLKEARTLIHKKQVRTEQETARLEELAQELHELSPSLAYELHLELECEQLEVNIL